MSTGPKEREKGFKSVIQLAKIGVSSRADVDVTYKSSDGSELSAKITHSEAKKIFENLEDIQLVRYAEDTIRRSPPSAQTLSSIRDVPSLITGDEIQRSEAHYFLQSILESLLAVGMLSAVPRISDEMRRKGRSDLASALDEKARGYFQH